MFYAIIYALVGHSDLPDWMIPIMTPNKPKALPKISMIRILTKVDGVWASAKAAPDPVTPTQMPQHRLDRPTAKPAEKRAYPLNSALL